MTQSIRDKYAEQTQALLIETGEELFGKSGYSETSAEKIVSAAGVTRGALYHHFQKGKSDLFKKVAQNLLDRFKIELNENWNEKSSFEKNFTNALNCYFDFVLKKEHRIIMLQDAPAVLGWQQWRKMEHNSIINYMTEKLENMMTAGNLNKQPAPMLASILFGACCDAALTIAESKNQKKAREDALQILGQLLKV